MEGRLVTAMADLMVETLHLLRPGDANVFHRNRFLRGGTRTRYLLRELKDGVFVGLNNTRSSHIITLRKDQRFHDTIRVAEGVDEMGGQRRDIDER